MKASECELNEMYRSKNPIAINCKYQVVKMNKTTCWVKLIENNEPTEVLYKNVPYSVLIKNKTMATNNTSEVIIDVVALKQKQVDIFYKEIELYNQTMKLLVELLSLLNKDELVRLAGIKIDEWNCIGSIDKGGYIKEDDLEDGVSETNKLDTLSQEVLKNIIDYILIYILK